jgi:hypothetical protein
MNIPFLYPKSKKHKNAQAPLGLHSHLVASPTLRSSESEQVKNERCEHTIDLETYQSPILLQDLTDEAIITPHFDDEDWNNTRGFTSSELACVLVIIALMIGAFQSGQALVTTLNCMCELSPSFSVRDSCLDE